MNRVQYRISCVKPGTDTLVNSVSVGQDFDLVLKTTDLRPNPNNEARGVFAAFADIFYNKNLVDVRAAEIQLLTFSPTVRTGKFKLTVTDSKVTKLSFWRRIVTNASKTTAEILFDNRTLSGIIKTQQNIENGLNAVLGAGSVKVHVEQRGLSYSVKFIGFYDVDRQPLKPNVSNITVKEIAKGDTNLKSSFLTGVQFSELYQNLKNGSDEVDRIGNLGAVLTNLFDSVGNDEVEVARVRLLAKQKGVVNFELGLTNYNNPSPAFNTLVFTNITAIPPENKTVGVDEIGLINTWLTIV